MGRYRLAVAALLLFANAAKAESWYKGSAGRRRIVHLAAIGVGGGVYLSSETFLKDNLAPRTCLALLNQGVKFAVGRRRPFVEYGDPTRPSDLDDNVSFYSGHTTFTLALATSAGVVAHRRGYRLEPEIWAGGYVASIATGYLRMAADRHYFSDVVVGALAGTAIGIVVPIALDNNVRIVPARDGVAVAGQF